MTNGQAAGQTDRQTVGQMEGQAWQGHQSSLV